MDESFLNNNFNKGNSWRAGLAIFVVILAILFFFLNRSQFILPDLKEVNNFIQPIENILNKQNNISQPVKIVKPKLPVLKTVMLDNSKFSAKTMIVKDKKTGAVLFRKNEYEKRPIASITKLMSALVVLEKKPDWLATTTVVGADSLDTHMYAGDVFTLEDLWQASLVGSSNKAILTLSQALGWPPEAFIERMNTKALELGMTDAYFADTTGLSEENVASASDIAILLKEALENKKIQETLLTKEITLYSAERKKSHHIWNTNRLLLGWVPQNFYEIVGGKTGYIVASGYNFAMQVGDSAGHKITVVVLGADTNEARFTEAKEVGEWVFANYTWPN